MAEKSTFEKDPSAVLRYQFDWRAYSNQGISSDWLADDETITTYTITTQTGLTKDSDSQSNGAVTVVLSGGTAGTT